MRYLRSYVAIAIVAVALLFAATAGAAGKGSVTVIKRTCDVVGFGGTYSGSSKLVIKDGDVTMTQCHATLVSGTPVARTVVIHDVPQGGCNVTFTRGGRAHIVCPHGP